jgi:hypothetical protein
MRYLFFWDVLLCHWVIDGYSTFEDQTNMLSQKVGHQSASDASEYPRRTELTCTASEG